MRIFPTDSREWRRLILLPGQAYVLIAPGCFYVWDLTAAEHRVRGAWMDAAETIDLGYVICFLMFAVAGLVFCLTRHTDSAFTSLLFMLLAFVFPMSMISSRNSLGMAAVSVFIALWKFSPVRQRRESSSRNEEAFGCPNCNAVVSGSEQKCSACGWTYVV